MLNPDDVAACRVLLKHHGKSYAFATLGFPRALQDATAVLYAFFRVPDDIVDELPGTVEEKTTQLLAWKDEWRRVSEGETTSNPVLRAAHEVCDMYHIPLAYTDAFLDAMIQDLTVARYETYAELEQYMYGSAAVVGYMMSHVIGFQRQETLLYARALGEAMQLTNFIRDMKDDLEMRGRVYIPEEDLRRFHVTEEDIRAHRVTEPVRQLLQFEIERARRLYAYAEEGISELAIHGQVSVRVASRCYEAILTKIEKAQYDIFTQRIHTTLFEKIVIFFFVWIQHVSMRLSSVLGLGA